MRTRTITGTKKVANELLAFSMGILLFTTMFIGGGGIVSTATDAGLELQEYESIEAAITAQCKDADIEILEECMDSALLEEAREGQSDAAGIMIAYCEMDSNFKEEVAYDYFQYDFQ